MPFSQEHQHSCAVLVLEAVAIIMPRYPHTVEVKAPTTNAIAVCVVAARATKTEKITVNTARTWYSATRKLMAPSEMSFPTCFMSSKASGESASSQPKGDDKV